MSNTKKIRKRGAPKAADIEQRKERRIAIEKTSDLLTMVWCMVLHDKRGYRKSRLEDCLQEVTNLADSIRQGYCTVKDLQKTLEEETGIDCSKFRRKKKAEKQQALR